MVLFGDIAFAKTIAKKCWGLPGSGVVKNAVQVSITRMLMTRVKSCGGLLKFLDQYITKREAMM